MESKRTEGAAAADAAAEEALAESEELERPIGPPQAMYFYGVVRARGWRGRTDEDEIARVRYRDIEALVRPVPYTMPPLDQEHVQDHQRAVERAMRRGTILPAPYGVVFRGRRQLIRLLQDQYLVFDEGLSFLDGHWELRLHVTAAAAVDVRADLRDVATDVYTELRRFARAAVPFPRDDRRLLSAAFLVERTSWLEFMERVSQLNTANPELGFDITGPWPAYDFVRIVG